MAFLPRDSDLPLQVAFPLLMANLTGELLGGSAVPAQAIAPGDPVTIPVPAGATSVVVTRPDSSTVELVPGTPAAASVAFSQTDLLGVYSAAGVFPNATPGPSGSSGAAPSAIATPRTSSGPAATLAPGATPTAVPTAPPVDPTAPVRFAVDLFDPNESDIAPGSPSAIMALGRQAGASGSPEGSAGPGATTTPEPGATAATSAAGTDKASVARDELWVVIVLVVLVVLLAEWLVYQRDAVTRIWRAIRRRPVQATTAPVAPTADQAGRRGRGR
jgi:hypothetical protein